MGGRADVSALVDYTSGACLQLEHDKHLSYGTPWVRGGLPAGDLDSDGDYDINDEKDIDALILATGYDVRADADLDGAVTAYDKADLSGSKITLGRGLMSDSGTFNRRGYAGYDNDGVLGDGANPGSNTRFWHVRHRVLDSTIGRWTRRDPAGYVDGANLMPYAANHAIQATDPSGLMFAPCLFNVEVESAASFGRVVSDFPNRCVSNPTLQTQVLLPIINSICTARYRNHVQQQWPTCPHGCDCDVDLHNINVIVQTITWPCGRIRGSVTGCSYTVDAFVKLEARIIIGRCVRRPVLPVASIDTLLPFDIAVGSSLRDGTLASNL